MLIALAVILAVLLVVFMIVKVVAAVVGLVWLLLVALICGALAEQLLHYKAGGIVRTTAIGLVGAVVGWLIAKVAHLPLGLSIGSLPVLWTIVGSMVLVGTMKVVTPSKRRRLGSGSGLSRW